MNEIIVKVLSFGIPTIIILAILAILTSGYLKAPPDKAYIISGIKKNPRMLIGQAGIKIPFFERLDRLDLSLIPVDVKTSSEVPTADYINIKVDSNVNVRVGKTPEMLSLASTHFLNQPADYIGHVAQQVLEGNMREIVGQMKLEDMVSDRQKFAELVKENAAPDLAEMGLEILNFNVQNFADANGVIENLGVDNVVRIQKNAAISRAQSERDIAIEKAKAAKESNDAKVLAAEEIAKRNNDLAIKQAQLKKEADTQQAIADAAQEIEAEKQRQARDVAATNADIAKAERMAELKKQEIELKERELDALVRKQADADKYAAEQRAEAELIARQKDAEAKRYEAEQQAQASKAKADADKYAALAQAEGIAAVGSAKAEAIQKKAEAQKKMGEASVIEMVLKTLPEMTAAAAAPLANVDTMTVYGSDGGSKMVSDVMKTTNQVMEGLKANGIDISSLLNGFMGGKIASKTEENK